MALESGAVDVVTKVMNTHIERADICGQGCGVIWCITSGEYRNNQNKYFIILYYILLLYIEIPTKVEEKYEYTGIILNILTEYIENEGVVENGCGALWGIVLKGGVDCKKQQTLFLYSFNYCYYLKV